MTSPVNETVSAVPDEAVEAAAARTRSLTFSALTIDEYNDLVSAVINAYLMADRSTRSAPSVKAKPGRADEMEAVARELCILANMAEIPNGDSPRATMKIGAKLIRAAIRLIGERDALREHVELLKDKFTSPDNVCGCAFDDVDDVCMVHSPIVHKLEARADKAEKALEKLQLEIKFSAARALHGGK